jgi:hypothetical protein
VYSMTRTGICVASCGCTGVRGGHPRRPPGPDACTSSSSTATRRRPSNTYLTPTEDNQRQCESLTRLGIFDSAYDEVGEIIVADVNRAVVRELVQPVSEKRERLITGPRPELMDST